MESKFFAKDNVDQLCDLCHSTISGTMGIDIGHEYDVQIQNLMKDMYQRIRRKPNVSYDLHKMNLNKVVLKESIIQIQNDLRKKIAPQQPAEVQSISSKLNQRHLEQGHKKVTFVDRPETGGVNSDVEQNFKKMSNFREANRPQVPGTPNFTDIDDNANRGRPEDLLNRYMNARSTQEQSILAANSMSKSLAEKELGVHAGAPNLTKYVNTDSLKTEDLAQRILDTQGSTDGLTKNKLSKEHIFQNEVELNRIKQAQEIEAGVSFEQQQSSKSIADIRNTTDTIISKDQRAQELFKESLLAEPGNVTEAQVAAAKKDIDKFFPTPLDPNIPLYSRNNISTSYRIPKKLMLDSRDRDYSKYTEPYNYRINLKYTYKNVVCVELISAVVPMTEYIINENNNVITFQETNGTNLTATVSEGDYTESTLPAVIKAALEAAGASTYTVTIDSATSKITIASNGAGGGGIFSLIFFGGNEVVDFNSTTPVYPNNSIGAVLGFPRSNQTGSLTYTGPGSVVLTGDTYVIMRVAELEEIDSNDPTSDKAFGKIVFEDITNIEYHSTGPQCNIKHFSPPLGELSNLTIEFRKHGGGFYNFHRHEHSLFFQITMQSDYDRTT